MAKHRIESLCEGHLEDCLIRIACHEVEAWYFGDLSALSKAYGKDFTYLSKKKKYRVPDDIINPRQELRKLIPEHEQISAAKKIAPYMDVESNTSTSFKVLISGINRLVKTGEK